jgi:hypothetical protein
MTTILSRTLPKNVSPNKMRRYRYERIYGVFNGRTVRVEGAQAVGRSAERYTRHVRRGLRT